MRHVSGSRVATLVLLFAWPLAAAAQDHSFRSGVELVNLNVTVVGGNQQHVNGLDRSQF